MIYRRLRGGHVPVEVSINIVRVISELMDVTDLCPYIIFYGLECRDSKPYHRDGKRVSLEYVWR